jgi:hypothetical protein
MAKNDRTAMRTDLSGDGVEKISTIYDDCWLTCLLFT